jgi:penicillin-binding protein-related factor A (putative recombinase)
VTERAVAGRLARVAQRRSGDALERLVEATCAAYRVLAWDDRAYRLRRPGDPPAAVLSRAHPKAAGKPGKTLKYVRRGGVDFVGTFWDAGRAVPLAFDAKRCTGERLFGLDEKGLHQARFLADWVAAGGVGFFLVEDPKYEGGTVWAVTAFVELSLGQRVPLRHANGPLWESMRRAELTPHVPGYDVLRLARRLMGRVA